MSIIKQIVSRAMEGALCLILGLAGTSTVSQTISTQAQWEQDQDTDHLVLGGFIQTTDSFRSDKPIFIDTTLMLETQADTTVHLGGPITNVFSMRKGINKTGQGRLVLSGLNTYDGNLQLRQGTLELQSNHALGAIGSVVHAYLGTQLIYQPGINVPNNLQIVNAVYDPAQPPVGPYADSVQWWVNSGVATQHGYMVLGTAGFVKQGQGVLRLAGNSFDAGGRLDVMQGGLQTDGIIRGTAHVFDGAWLQGQGRLGQARIGSGGTLLSGKQPAGLVIERSLVFEPDAVFQVDVGAAGVGGPVHVQGVASLAGWVKAHTHDLAAELWPASWEYPVLQADGGFDGTAFAGVETNMSFLQAGLRYDDNHVYLQFSPKVIVDAPPDLGTEPVVVPVVDPVVVAETEPTQGAGPEAKPATEAEPSLESEPESDTPPEIGSGGNLGPDKGPVVEAETALEITAVSATEPARQKGVETEVVWPFSGSWAASILSAVNEDSRFLRQSALRHITQPRSGAFLWADTYYSHAERRGNREQPDDDRDVSGLVLGLQQPWGQRGQFSVFAGVQHSRLHSRYGVGGQHSQRQGRYDVDGQYSQRQGRNGVGEQARYAALQGSASATVASGHLGFSAAWQSENGLSLAVGAAHSWHRLHSRRAVMARGLDDSVSARYGGRTSQVFAEVAMPVWQTPTSDISPRNTPASHLNSRNTAASHLSSRNTPASHLNSRNTPASHLTPYLRLAWVETRTSAHTEKGGPAALQLASARHSVVYTTLGIKAGHTMATNLGTATLYGDVAWRYAGGNTTPKSNFAFASGGNGLNGVNGLNGAIGPNGANSVNDLNGANAANPNRYTASGWAIPRHSLVLQLGVEATLGRNSTLSVGYTGLHAAHYHDHGVQLALRVAF